MSEGKSIFEEGGYVMSQEKLVLDNATWDEELRLRYQQQEEAKSLALLERKRARLEKVKQAMRLAEQERLAREKAEEKVVGEDGEPDTVPAELVKEEADNMLAEAREKLEAAARERGEATAVLREARLAAEKMTEEMRAAAEKKAEEIEREARGKAEQEGFAKGQGEGYAKGLDEGTAKGLEKGLAELAELKAAYEKVLRELSQRADAAISERAEKVNGVVMDIARRVVAAELEVKAEVVVNVVGEALGKIRDTNKVIIHLNPQDVQEARRHRHDFLAALDGVFNLQMVEDETVGRGGCMIETGSGLVDARLESKLTEIAQELELPAAAESSAAAVVADAADGAPATAATAAPEAEQAAGEGDSFKQLEAKRPAEEDTDEERQEE